ncbi:MAG: PorV/PorQ family protein, partial [Elusimicrobia bacterium]|nr:PorV/PorQ family protein [Elusimicrobiota bacterium]
MKRLRLFLLITLQSGLLLKAGVWADFNAKSAGTSGAAFLKVGAGARPVALGDAFVGIADDVNTIQSNTAGLATLKKNEFVAMRASLFQDIEYNFFAFAYPTQSQGTFALGLNSLLVSDIEKRTADTDAPDSTFSSNDSAYTLAYARKVWDPSSLGTESSGLRLGAGLKYIRQSISGEIANSYAADLGSLYHFSDWPMTLGLSVQNLGSKVKFKSESDSLPLTVQCGASYRLGEQWEISGVESEEDETKRGLLLALEVHLPRDDDPSLRAGSEFTRLWT